MNYMALLDGPSALIVFGGTAAATLLRCGPAHVGATLGRVVRSLEPRFDAARTRASLAPQVRAIQRDGPLRTAPQPLGDPEIDEATDLLIATRSVAALLHLHETHRAKRQADSAQAVQTLSQAAELAPVFGLAGTLVSLSQMSHSGAAAAGLGAGLGAGLPGAGFPGAISMAVLTTLYGLLAANLVLAPLARMIERSAQSEEAGRQAVIDWLAQQFGTPPTARPAVRRVA